MPGRQPQPDDRRRRQREERTRCRTSPASRTAARPTRRPARPPRPQASPPVSTIDDRPPPPLRRRHRHRRRLRHRGEEHRRAGQHRARRRPSSQKSGANAIASAQPPNVSCAATRTLPPVHAPQEARKHRRRDRIGKRIGEDEVARLATAYRPSRRRSPAAARAHEALHRPGKGAERENDQTGIHPSPRGLLPDARGRGLVRSMALLRFAAPMR